MKRGDVILESEWLDVTSQLRAVNVRDIVKSWKRTCARTISSDGMPGTLRLGLRALNFPTLNLDLSSASIQTRPPGRSFLAHYWFSIRPNQQRRAGLEISLSLSAYNATKIVVGSLACWCVPSTPLKAMYPLSLSPLGPVDCQMGSNMSVQNIYDPLDIASRIDWSFDCSRIGGKLSLYSYFKSSGIRYYILALAIGLASKFNFSSMIESSNVLRVGFDQNTIVEDVNFTSTLIFHLIWGYSQTNFRRGG